MTHTEQGGSLLCVRWTVMWISNPIFNLHRLCSITSCVIVNYVQLHWNLFGLNAWKGCIEFCHQECCCKIHTVCKLASCNGGLCVFFSQSWRTACRSWQPFWNMRLWILRAPHHHARYRRMFRKHQLIFQWSCMNHLNHQILYGKIYTPCHCRFLWLCLERWISRFFFPCLFPHSVHVIGPAESSIEALLNLPECWIVCCMHLFNYLFKLSVNWPGGIILSNVPSNCGGGGQFVVVMFCCCCLFV